LTADEENAQISRFAQNFTPAPRRTPAKVNCRTVSAGTGSPSGLESPSTRAELERLERVRNDLVINVSHELRTPLASIQGYTER
jgi:signal transduction histidine kinase